ncbi:protein LTO1 homolog isoform X1 [Ambystoma mexicanum]|uniref:protein LTO1 homolog isoform X1 n=1 Tax=Ambystoma mexicanum TaxID=8296 RepID=UPI0037E92E0D
MAAAEDDIFDSIVMAEERFHGEGYEEGYSEGVHAGVNEGHQYGVLNGSKTGSEIGFYLGFALTWKSLLNTCTNEDDKLGKKLKALDILEGMISEFPWDDATNDKLQENLDKVRGKFKQVCSLLNIQPDFMVAKDGSGLSF